MFSLIRHLPWQILVLILIICILVILPYIPRILKKGPKILTVTLLTFILSWINLIFIYLGKNMGESIGITPKHVDILNYIFAVLFVLSMILLVIVRYQQVKHDEKKRKHFLRGICGFIIGIIIYIIIILL